MDTAMEEAIAKAFILANKRDRFLFTLQKRRRLDAICNLPSIIDKSLSVMNSTSFPAPVALIRVMQSYGVQDTCYVLSEYEDGFDGVYAPLDDAAQKLHTNGFPSLIVGLPSGFSHLKGESYASYQPNCFLKPAVRFDGVRWA